MRRTEFLEILSSMGLYILEKGKALEAASDSLVGNQLSSHQARQIRRIKGENASTEQSMRIARKFVMSGDYNRGGSAHEFQVTSISILMQLI